MLRTTLFISLGLLILASCKQGPGPDPIIPEIIIRDATAFEKDETFGMIFEVVALDTVSTDIEFTYELTGETAEPDVDFVSTSGTGTISAGQSVTQIAIDVIGDDINEMDETFRVILTSATNATLGDSTALGVITDEDEPLPNDADGYITAESIYGYELVWQDEFNGNELNLDDYNYEIGDGCDQNLCGWGNNEKQLYTDAAENIRVENGKLIMTATKTGPSSYNSARIQTKGKQEFEFGRIDIRAKLPEGQGIWPALWMLGDNIDEVGWPACGEIDIMELIGHQPKAVHGTAHWGADGSSQSTFSTSTYSIDEGFQDAFHVFSIVWKFNQIEWYVDETRYKILTFQDMNGATYRFNNAFYFIFNVAVGGNWPGNPDETTVFPQTMEIDYIRVFK